MFELAFIEQCADPSLEIAIVERFISEVGTDNPLAITITDGNRLILPEAPQTPEAAMRLIERFVGQAVVRVGVTRYPAGHGMTDVSGLSLSLFDPCENIRMGTALFGKVHRIVAHARGAADRATFVASLEAWRTGMFEGRYVFGEADPGPHSPSPDEQASSGDASLQEEVHIDASTPASETSFSESDPNQAGIRVDLSGISDGQEQ